MMFQTSYLCPCSHENGLCGCFAVIHTLLLLMVLCQCGCRCFPDWNNTTVLARETNNSIHRIRVAIWIRKNDNMNRDEGAYQLSHMYDNILIQKQPSTWGGGPRKTSTFTLTQQQQQSVNNSKTSTQAILMWTRTQIRCPKRHVNNSR